MTKSETYAVLSGLLLWGIFYTVTLYSVQWLLSADLPKIYSAIPAGLGYLVPGYVAARLAKKRIAMYGSLIGVTGSVAWLIHSELYSSLSLYVGAAVVVNVILSLAGALLARRTLRA